MTRRCGLDVVTTAGHRQPDRCITDVQSRRPSGRIEVVRIIAGAAKGRRLTTPSGRGTRPTSDRVREALFSALQQEIPAARVADLYAGSGALGMEALSRGAQAATFVERAPRAREAVQDNLRTTGFVDRAIVVAGEVRSVLREGIPGAPFDVVLMDPPYDIDAEELATVLVLLEAAVAPDGLVVVERGRRSPPPKWPAWLREQRARRYGETMIYVARAA